MKKLVGLIVFMLIISSVYSQSFHSVPYYDWSSNIAFMVSPSPIIVGYGPLSDSLSKTHHDSIFYEYNGEYYPITSWADYYLWYVNKYWYYFDQPDLYEYYYMAGDDYGMAQYICGRNYHGYFYPARIAISFPGREVYVNYYSAYRVKRRLKNNSWVNRNYVAVNGRDMNENIHRSQSSNIATTNKEGRKFEIHNYTVGNRKLKQKTTNGRELAYSNGPVYSERNMNETRNFSMNHQRRLNSIDGNKTKRQNYRTNVKSNASNSSNNRASNSSISRSITTLRNTSGISNNSRQTQTSRPGRAR